MTDFIDADTASTVTAITTVDAADFIDAATVTITTQISTVEITSFIDASILATKTTITSDDRGPFTDLATISTKTAITLGEYDYVHPTGKWGPFDDDEGILPAIYTDAKTITSRTTVSAVEIYTP